MENGLGLVAIRRMPFGLSMATLHFSILSRPGD